LLISHRSNTARYGATSASVVTGVRFHLAALLIQCEVRDVRWCSVQYLFLELFFCPDELERALIMRFILMFLSHLLVVRSATLEIHFIDVDNSELLRTNYLLEITAATFGSNGTLQLFL
jgi:hypothetical protein